MESIVSFDFGFALQLHRAGRRINRAEVFTRPKRLINYCR